MKKNYLLFILILSACGSDNEEETKNVNIEKHYTYYQKSLSANDVDDSLIELFNQKSFRINSISELENNPLFDYLTDYFIGEFYKCDFEKYTLIVISSSTIHKISYVDYKFTYNTNEQEYTYFQNLKCAPLEEPAENIYFLINAFLVKKISNDPKILVNTAITVI